MKKQLLFLCIVVMCSLTLMSCRAPQPHLRTVSYDQPYRFVPIATAGRARVSHLIDFFIETNPNVNKHRLSWIASIYVDEALAEGINSDIAFCQMVHETNYLQFGGDVHPHQNNFCGLGATGGGEPGHFFPSVRIGIRAHIQHLKAYANTKPLRNKLVDPRFLRVRRSEAPFIDDLTGTWAVDPQYGNKLKRKLRALGKYL